MSKRIWKYHGQTTRGKQFKNQRNWIVLGILVIMMVMSFGISALFIIAQKLQMNMGIIKWMITIALILLTVVVVLTASSVGRKTQGMEYAFARDSEGRMYIFYYRELEFQKYLIACGEKYQHIHTSGSGGIATAMSYFSSNRKEAKLIELVERYRIIENIMERGSVYPYGHEILRVESLRHNWGGSRIKCVLGNKDGSSYCANILLPDTYENYEELLTYLEMKK